MIKMNGRDLLIVEDLKTQFRTLRGAVKAVDGVSIKVKEGEVVGIVGESGCGKTTLALSIIGLIRQPGQVVAGNIFIKDKKIASEAQFRELRGSKISMCFQDPTAHLNPLMKISDQIAEAIVQHEKIGRSEARRRSIEILKLVQIPAPSRVADSYPHQLSGGMRQRVLIGIAISCNPSIVILDEPTTAVDVTVQAQILELIKDYRNRFQTSIMMITHDLGVVAELCDKVYVMYAGKIVEYGDVFSIFGNPKHPYTEGLLESTLSIDEYKETLVSIGGFVPDLVNPPKGCRFRPRCKYVTSICGNEEPKATLVDPGHVTYCWMIGREIKPEGSC